MSQYVTDTHALLWHLTHDPNLSAAARAIFLATDAGQVDIFIPSIVLVEVVYLSERQRVPTEMVERIAALPNLPGSHYHAVALDTAVVQALRHIPREIVPDMPDRIIAATAMLLGLPLLTRDGRISSLNIVTSLW